MYSPPYYYYFSSTIAGSTHPITNFHGLLEILVWERQEIRRSIMSPIDRGIGNEVGTE